MWAEQSWRWLRHRLRYQSAVVRLHPGDINNEPHYRGVGHYYQAWGYITESTDRTTTSDKANFLRTCRTAPAGGTGLLTSSRAGSAGLDVVFGTANSSGQFREDPESFSACGRQLGSVFPAAIRRFELGCLHG